MNDAPPKDATDWTGQSPQKDAVRRMLGEMATVLSLAKDDQMLEVLLDGLLTPSEIVGIHRRWQLLASLAKGMTQRDIQSQLGIGIGKVSRGSRILKYDHPELMELLQKYNAGLDSTTP